VVPTFNGELIPLLMHELSISAAQSTRRSIIKRLMVYLTKSIDQAAGLGDHATDAQRRHEIDP
jgi:hypothetical protein